MGILHKKALFGSDYSWNGYFFMKVSFLNIFICALFMVSPPSDQKPSRHPCVRVSINFIIGKEVPIKHNFIFFGWWCHFLSIYWYRPIIARNSSRCIQGFNLGRRTANFAVPRRRIFSHSPAHKFPSPAKAYCPYFLYYLHRVVTLKDFFILQLKLGRFSIFAKLSACEILSFKYASFIKNCFLFLVVCVRILLSCAFLPFWHLLIKRK